MKRENPIEAKEGKQVELRSLKCPDSGCGDSSEECDGKCDILEIPNTNGRITSDSCGACLSYYTILYSKYILKKCESRCGGFDDKHIQTIPGDNSKMTSRRCTACTNYLTYLANGLIYKKCGKKCGLSKSC
jgi:hypothetical protein